MAPRKRRSGGDEEEKAVPAVASRVTRRSSANQNGSSLPPDSKAKKNINKKAKISSNSGEDRAVPSKEGAAPPAEMFDDTSKHKTIIIEHCKQCNSFKTRAIQVKNGLENGVSGISVLLNPEKPRRGCFEIREEGGEKFITLLDMKRPFKPMKALDMDKVISDIIDKIK